MWHVADLSFYTDRECAEASRIPSESILRHESSDGLRYEASDGDTNESSNESHLAFDEEGDATVWEVECSSTTCTAGSNATWLAVHLAGPASVGCLRLLQGEEDFRVDTFALDFWLPAASGEGAGVWERVRVWHDVRGLSQNMGESHLQVVCNENYPTGVGLTHDCQGTVLPWGTCTAFCRPGYAGPTAEYMCLESYEFHGSAPICEPMPCTEGIPSDKEVSSEQCLGLRTYDRCTATCALGYRGSPLEYVCEADGVLREVTTLMENRVPVCIMVMPDEISSSAPRAAGLSLALVSLYLSAAAGTHEAC